MTISTSSTRELSIGTLVRRSLQLAGLLSSQQDVPTADAALGRDLLEVVIDNLATEGIFARSVKFVDVSLTVGTYRYDLADDVLDVVDDAMYLRPGIADATKGRGETLIRQIRRNEFHELSSKDAEGIPTLFYTHREGPTLQVWFWPIPSEDAVNSIPAKARLQVHRLLADNNDANATPDLQRYWAVYLQWQLAHDFAAAKSLPVERLVYFKGQAQSYLDKCRSYANQRPSTQSSYWHPTPWSR